MVEIRWNNVKLSSLLEKVIDNRGKTPPWLSEGLELIETTSLVGNHKFPNYDLISKYVSENTFNAWFRSGHPIKGDILIATVGANIGSVAIMKASRGCIAQNLVALRPNSEIVNANFLFYFISSQRTQQYLKKLDIGAAQPSIKVSHFLDIDISLPSLIIQNKIAFILSVYDDLIENNNRRIKILEEMAQTIYNEWFVKFLFPGHSKVKMVKSELGEIPEGWEVAPVVDILVNYIGGGWGKDKLEDNYFCPAYVIRGTDIPKVKYMSIKSCPLRFHSRSNFFSRKLETNDIVMEVSGGSKEQAVGRALITTKRILEAFDGDVICASFCKLLRLKKDILLPLLFILHLDFIYKNKKIEQYQVQSTGITNFKFGVFLEKEKVLIPPRNLQQKFFEIVNPLVDLKELLGLKNQNLQYTRDFLLPRLISGELDVENLDIKVDN